ncbi:hypothetical protein NESM_000798100 [Novymonas esmeraldas]|uniref:Uncharacterized protein n=1 Tax=Novymonas esmeraldas TaxID=1808958 RepID=A0AAW0EZE5_9TRYP
MGNDLSSVQGGGNRNVEAWSEARARRLERRLSSPLGRGGDTVPPAVHLHGDARHAAEDASYPTSSSSSSRSPTMESAHTTHNTTSSKPRSPHRTSALGSAPSESSTAPATMATAAAPLTEQEQDQLLRHRQRQLQKRTQYSRYAHQMRHGDGALSPSRLGSGVDFIVANEFFSHSDHDSSNSGGDGGDGNDDLRSTRSSSSSKSSSSKSRATGSDAAASAAAAAEGQQSVPYRAGRSLGRRLTQEEMLERRLQRETAVVPGAPAVGPVSSTNTTTALPTSARVPPVSVTEHRRTTSATTRLMDKHAAAPTTSAVGDNVRTPALTSSSDSSAATHSKRSSATSGRRGGSGASSPSASAASGWRKRLMLPVTNSNRRSAGDVVANTTSATAGPRRAREEATHAPHHSKDSDAHPRHQPHPPDSPRGSAHRRTTTAAAASSPTTATAPLTALDVDALLSGTDASVTKDALRSMTNAELSRLDFSAQKARKLPRTAERRGTDSTSPYLSRAGASGSSERGEYGSFMRMTNTPLRGPSSPQQRQQQSVDDGVRWSVGRDGGGGHSTPMRASASPAQPSRPPSSNRTSSFFRRLLNSDQSDSAGSTLHRVPLQRLFGGSRENGSKTGESAAAGTAATRVVDTKHNHRRPKRTGSVSGSYDIRGAVSNDFLADIDGTNDYPALYGDGGEKSRDGGIGHSTASMRETACLAASAGGAASRRSFGSLFAGSHADSTSSLVSLAPPPAWVGDYVGAGLASTSKERAPATPRAGAGDAVDASACLVTAAWHAQQQADRHRAAYTPLGQASPSPSPGAPSYFASVTPEGSDGVPRLTISISPTPPCDVVATAWDQRRGGRPAVAAGSAVHRTATAPQSAMLPPPHRRNMGASLPVSDNRSTRNTGGGADGRRRRDGGVGSGSFVSSNSSGHGGGGGGLGSDSSHSGSSSSSENSNSRSSSSSSSTSPDVSVSVFVKSARAKPPPPSSHWTATTEAKNRRGGGGGVGLGHPSAMTRERNSSSARAVAPAASAFLATAAAAAAAAPTAAGAPTTPKKPSSSSSGGGGGGSGGGAVATAAAGPILIPVLTSSSDAAHPTRADSKDFILRPDRSASGQVRRSGDEQQQQQQQQKQRRSSTRSHSSTARHRSSFSFSSDSLLYGKACGRLAKAAAAAVAANSNSAERRRRGSTSDGDSAASLSASSVSASRRGDSSSHRRRDRHPPHSQRSETSVHRHSRRRGGEAVTSSDRKREMRSRHNLLGGDSELGSMVAGLDDLLLGHSGRNVSDTYAAGCPRTGSSSSSSMAPSSRNSSVSVGSGSGGVGAGSIRALRKKAAKARDLSTSSSVDSETSGRGHSHSTALPLPPPHLSDNAPATRPHLLVTSNSSGGTTTGGACGMTLASFQLHHAADMSSSDDLGSDRAANSGGYRVHGDFTTTAHAQRQQHQQRVTSLPSHAGYAGELTAGGKDTAMPPPRSPAGAQGGAAAAGPPGLRHNYPSSVARLDTAAGVTVSVPLPKVNGAEAHARRSASATTIAGPHAVLHRGSGGGGGGSSSNNNNGSVGGVGLPHLEDMTGDGDGGAPATAAASLLNAPSRDSSQKRRRPTTQSFTPWSVDMNRFKALQEKVEGS